ALKQRVVQKYIEDNFESTDLSYADLSNKNVDEVPSEYLDKFTIPIFEVSAATHAGVENLKNFVAQKVHEFRSELAVEQEISYDKVWEARRLERDQKFEVENIGSGIWRVSGPAIERMVMQTEFDNDEAVLFLQSRLEKAGVEKRLVESGAVAGDEIRILEVSFEFQPALWDV
ncbi:MAG: Obg family GTPase CgtA, partial [Coriobacteriales bacterium]|nr:Obg family GTPase CgtA [Coriobacteriales bacterium]